MTNPAQQLHALLTPWYSADKQLDVYRARGGKPDGDLQFWRTHGRAVGLLLEIETLLEGLKAAGEDVSGFERQLPDWYRAVFAPQTAWQSAGNSATKTRTRGALDHLWSLGRVLDAYKFSETLDPTTVQELLTALDEAEQITRDADLPDNERFYILGLIAEARRVAADVESFGSAGARKLTIELGGAMVMVAGRTNDASIARRCRDVTKRLLSAVWWKIADRAIDAGVDGVINQIGSS